MCRVKTFCCCCSLRGAAITGAVWNAFFVLGMASSCFYFFYAYFTGDDGKVSKEHQRDTEIISYGRTTPYPPEAGSTAYLIIAIFAAIRVVIGLIVLVLLCIGIHKNRAGYILPWLILVLILIISGIVSQIGLFIAGVHWADVIGDLFVYVFWLYVWIAVYSFYKELQEGGPATAYVA